MVDRRRRGIGTMAAQVSCKSRRVYSHIKWVCMCRPMFKRMGLTELIKLIKWVPSELKER